MNDNKNVLSFAQAIRNIMPKAIKKIYWFGSRAREKGYPGSDYDLLIITSHKLTPGELDRLLDTVIDYEADQGIVYDFHCYTEREIKRPPINRSPFIIEVLEEGILI